MFIGWFVVIINVDYIILFLCGNLKVGGLVILYIGFGLMLVGILFSGFNQEVIFCNLFFMEGFMVSEEVKCNSVLLIKDLLMIMGEYEVILQNDIIDYLI